MRIEEWLRQNRSLLKKRMKNGPLAYHQDGFPPPRGSWRGALGELEGAFKISSL